VTLKKRNRSGESNESVAKKSEMASMKGIGVSGVATPYQQRWRALSDKREKASSRSRQQWQYQRSKTLAAGTGMARIGVAAISKQRSVLARHGVAKHQQRQASAPGAPTASANKTSMRHGRYGVKTVAAVSATKSRCRYSRRMT